MKKLGLFFKREVKGTLALLRSVPALLLTMFVLSLVLMNLLANKSIQLDVDWIALDMGIIVSWVAFLTLDIAVKSFGHKAATRLTIVAVVINLLISAVFIVAASIPGMWGEAYAGGDIVNNALNATIKGSWYILLGSTIAFITSAVVNNVLNWAVGKLFKKKPNSFIAFATRSYVSTMVAQFVDNLVFALIVSVNFFGWTLLQAFMCATTGALVELVCEIAFSPIGYRVSENWRKRCIGAEFLEKEPSI